MEKGKLGNVSSVGILSRQSDIMTHAQRGRGRIIKNYWGYDSITLFMRTIEWSKKPEGRDRTPSKAARIIGRNFSTHSTRSMKGLGDEESKEDLLITNSKRK